MIEHQVIENLIKLMVEHDLVELDVADGDQSVTLRRANSQTQLYPMAAPPTAMSLAAPISQQETSDSPSNPATADKSVTDTGDDDKNNITINSPMVGTFYSRPNPDTEPFVSVGSKVSDSSVVCLVEAMKVFNEIKAECAGVIAEVLVKDGDPVEYGQPMFKVKPY